VLGIEEDADDGQIKKAYRKLALKFHPDKNQGNEEEASKHFREVQSAYAVLIEPQERAWYDKHKDAILMKSGDYEDKEVALGEFFSPHCYSGFGDDANGFYGVYGVLFKQISEDDYTFMNNDEDDFPQFGDSFTDASFVVQVFYGFWQSYATKRTYVWEEEYDTREAPSRWVRRKMEQENAKTTEQLRKKRSQAVQALVDFVRRRDPRVKEFRRQLETKQAENKAKEKRLRDEKRMAEMLKAAEYEAANRGRIEEEARLLEQLEKELGYSDSFDSDEEEDEKPINDENMETLTEEQKEKIRVEMEAEEELARAIKRLEVEKKSKKPKKQKKKAKNKEDITVSQANANGEVDEIECTNAKMSKKQLKKLEKRGVVPESVQSDDDNLENGSEELTDEEEEVAAPVQLSKKQLKKLKKRGFVPQSTPSDVDSDNETQEVGEDSVSEEEEIALVQMSKKQLKKLKKRGFVARVESDDDGEEDAEEKEAVKIITPNAAPEVNDEENNETVTETLVEEEQLPTKKLTAKEKRRMREKERQEEAARRKAAVAPILECKVCNNEFDSRTKLFSHIEQTGHAVIKTTGASGKTTSKKGKRK